MTFTQSSQEKVERSLHTIVDDQENLAKDLAETGRLGFLYYAPWNRTFAEKQRSSNDQNIVVAMNWLEVGKIAEELAGSIRR